MAGLATTLRVSTGNQEVGCLTSSKGSCPPLNPMECENFSYDKYSLMQSFYEQVYEITTFLSQIALHKNASYIDDSAP